MGDCDEERIRHFRESTFHRSFTVNHARLLDLCLGRLPLTRDIQNIGAYLTDASLDNLAKMVELETVASLKQKMANPGDIPSDAIAKDPHPFDIFLIEKSLERHHCNLAICLPLKREEKLVWYDGTDQIWALTPPIHKWRVSSLSGPCRVLEALLEGRRKDLVRLAMEREGLVDVECGAEAEWPPEVEPIIAKLNEPQRHAVATVLSDKFESGFFVIQGPPGCGKTSTCVGMVAALKESVLVTAPSNAAVANLALKLYQTGIYGIEDLVVFGENCDTSVQFLSPQFRATEFTRFLRKYNSASDIGGKLNMKRDFLAWLHLGSDDLNMAQLTQLCPDINTSGKEGRMYLKKVLCRAKVVFSSLNSSGSGFLRTAINVSSVLIDEAGQCNEAEFYIAASFPGVKRCVVVGDPCQLPPIVVDRQCGKAGFGKSWLESVLRLRPDKVHLLTIQYRMHPEILAFPNRTFYENRIQTGSNVLAREFKPEKPFSFIDTRRQGREDQHGFSWVNFHEVFVVKSLLFQDADIRRLLQTTREVVRLIIITPYNAQVRLLKEKLRRIKNFVVEVATVDSFQGQEAEIVILSSVRTRKVGFVDNAQRLNVALTRAMYIIRIVGEFSFFESIQPPSTLRELATYVTTMGQRQETRINCIPWSRPNWDQAFKWKPCFTSLFVHCLRKMQEHERNICWNTLHSLAIPNLNALSGKLQRRSRPGWYISSLKGYTDVTVVWIAKDAKTPIVQAEFAGSFRSSLHFTQTRPVPDNSCLVLPNFSGVMLSKKTSLETAKTSLETAETEVVVGDSSWRATNSTQKTVSISLELPLGCVQLDPSQEEVACTAPPVIVESRSGTGKTLVLLQHAAYNSDLQDDRPACFVTMSKRLRNVLLSRYVELNQLENYKLPVTEFFTFRELIGELIRCKKIQDFEGLIPCTFTAFDCEKKSHERNRLDPHLIESEISGVILGSLTAAEQCVPLTREQYLSEIRSNIGLQTDQHISMRNYVYDRFEKYKTWKHKMKMYEFGEIVLRLLRESWAQIFSSAYLDEIQDLSYASIKLICSIAGKDSLRWICAGDPAQMISPGCCFTFDGLKQTLLSVQSGIEHHLSRVSQLLVNYRTTKDVLKLANEVLRVAKIYFPDAIPFARDEVARQNLGLKPVLCDWNAAFEQDVSLGTNQALVYSSTDDAKFEQEAKAWIGQHPFIISSLESKGLEFDDVIVAFDFERKFWTIQKKSMGSLRMLRELYVAVTRAKRRVVILLKGDIPAMNEFFGSLDCVFQTTGAELVLREFQEIVHTDQWVSKARDLFEAEAYNMAARCFSIANEPGWYHWSSGKHLESTGRVGPAKSEYFQALRDFSMSGNYELVLDVSVVLATPPVSHASAVGDWDDTTSNLVNVAISKLPNYLNRSQKIRLALARERWDDISIEDLKDDSTANLFVSYRHSVHLKYIVRRSTLEDRIAVERVLPVLVGDYHCESNKLAEAVRIYLKYKFTSDAIKATKAAIKQTSSKSDCLAEVVEVWLRAGVKPDDQRIRLLLALFRSPTSMSAMSRADCIQHLGHFVIVTAVSTDPSIDDTFLYEFDRSEFIVEVNNALETKFADNLLDAVMWFLSKEDMDAALRFVQNRISKWTKTEMFTLLDILVDIPPWFFKEAEKRSFLPLMILTGMAYPSITNKIIHCFSAFMDWQSAGCNMFVISNWCFAQLYPDKRNQSKKPRGSKRLLDHPVCQEDSFVNHLCRAWQRGTIKTLDMPSNETLKEILRNALNCCGILMRKRLARKCVEENVGNKASTALVEVFFDFSFFDQVLQLTNGCIRSRKLGQDELLQLSSLWKINYSNFKSWAVCNIAKRDCLSDLLTKLISLTLRVQDAECMVDYISEWCKLFHIDVPVDFDKVDRLQRGALAKVLLRPTVGNKVLESVLEFCLECNMSVSKVVRFSCCLVDNGCFDHRSTSIVDFFTSEDTLSLLLLMTGNADHVLRPDKWLSILMAYGPVLGTFLRMTYQDPHMPKCVCSIDRLSGNELLKRLVGFRLELEEKLTFTRITLEKPIVATHTFQGKGKRHQKKANRTGKNEINYKGKM